MVLFISIFIIVISILFILPILFLFGPRMLQANLFGKILTRDV